MPRRDGWAERLATSRYCLPTSIGASLAIVIIGFGVFRRALAAVVSSRHLSVISFDPRHDPWFQASFLAPAALTLLALAIFFGPLCMALIRNRRYSAFAGTFAWGAVISSSFVFAMLFFWIGY